MNDSLSRSKPVPRFEMSCACCDNGFAICHLTKEASQMRSDNLAQSVQNGHGSIRHPRANVLTIHFKITQGLTPDTGFGTFTLFANGIAAMNAVVCSRRKASTQAFKAFTSNRARNEHHRQRIDLGQMKTPNAPWAALEFTTEGYKTVEFGWVTHLNDVATALAATMIDLAQGTD